MTTPWKDTDLQLACVFGGRPHVETLSQLIIRGLPVFPSLFLVGAMGCYYQSHREEEAEHRSTSSKHDHDLPMRSIFIDGPVIRARYLRLTRGSTIVGGAGQITYSDAETLRVTSVSQGGTEVG